MVEHSLSTKPGRKKIVPVEAAADVPAGNASVVRSLDRPAPQAAGCRFQRLIFCPVHAHLIISRPFEPFADRSGRAGRDTARPMLVAPPGFCYICLDFL